MAYERISDVKQIGGDLDTIIDSSIKLYQRQLTIRNAEDELRFNEAVLSGNITLQEQLDWRKEQLDRAKGDPDEVKRIRLELAHLKDRIEQRTFSDAYVEQLTKLGSGISSVDNIIEWLENQKANATDLKVRESINSALLEQKEKRFEIRKEVIENETRFALNDKSESVLNTHLEKVGQERNKALLSGDDLLISVYDLQIQSLNKAITENSVERSVTSFAVNTLSGGTNALQLLDAYNSELGNAPQSGNINIGGSLFGSAQEFWRFKRGQYITDSGADGFFTRFTKEKNQELGLLNAQRNLTIQDIQSKTKEYDQLLAREELRGFDFQVQVAKQETTQVGTNYIASDIFSKFTKDFDVNTAVASLNQLKTLGGDVSETYDKIIQVAAANKTSQVSSILQTVQEILRNDPNATAEEALNTAIASGAGSILSPEQLVGKNERDIVSEQISGAQNEQFGTDPRTTAKDKNTPTVVDPSITDADREKQQQQQQQQQEQQPNIDQPRFNFSNQLDFGASSEDVLQLQKFLNQSGFKVAEEGPGSPGNETNFFGELTQAAVKKFQQAQGIVNSGDPQSTGFGRVGPQTLEALNKFKI